MTDDSAALIVSLSGPDRTGIVFAISGVLAHHGWNIDDAQQFADRSTGRFFMRVEASGVVPEGRQPLEQELMEIATKFGMDCTVYNQAEKPGVMVLVSQVGHCLNDLLYRYSTGSLRCEIKAVVSNHPDFESLARAYGIAFHYLPVDPSTKASQEAQILALTEELDISLVVLARYMQILSPELVSQLEGRAINIHHSFLPSFKGARPYHQAYERGVKLIGATAHYVTSELDEGPIIEQEVARVDHRMSPLRLARLGEDLECLALSRAVSWHLERRVMLNGHRTIVFS